MAKAEYQTTPIQYGMKVSFSDGTVVNWFRDAKRRTVYPERNPHGHAFPPSATRIEQIVAVVRGERAPQVDSAPWRDADGRPLGAFDGGASPNPGPGGWGVVLPDDRELSGSEAVTTNNRMELTAAIQLLEATKGPLRAIGDSRYVIEGITHWIHGWRKRGWRTVTGSQVENQDLWERLGHLAEGREIVWEQVRGHSGHPLNERCDRLCAQARRTYRTSNTRRDAAQ
jgi:ribonuclease HI